MFAGNKTIRRSNTTSRGSFRSSDSGRSSICSKDGGNAGRNQTSIRSFFASAAAAPTQRRRRRISCSSRSSSAARPETPPTLALRESSNVAPPHTPPTPPPIPKAPPTPPLESLPAIATTSTNSTAAHRKKKSTSSNNNRNKKQRTHQQLYLDLGQRNFAQNTECSVCGMLFVHGLTEDAKRHQSICREYQSGVTFSSQTQCRVVSKFKVGVVAVDAAKKKKQQQQQQVATIVEIRPSDSTSLRKKVAQVKRIVDQELGFCDDDDDEDGTRPSRQQQHTAFLCVVAQRVVGMVLAERIDKAYKLLLDPQDHHSGSNNNNKASTMAVGLQRSDRPCTADIGIYQMWVHHKFRRASIARSTIDAVRAKMVFGYVVPVQRLAFSSPTTAGVQFALSYNNSNSTPSSDEDYDNTNVQVLVYDCVQQRR